MTKRMSGSTSVLRPIRTEPLKMQNGCASSIIRAIASSTAIRQQTSIVWSAFYGEHPCSGKRKGERNGANPSRKGARDRYNGLPRPTSRHSSAACRPCVARSFGYLGHSDVLQGVFRVSGVRTGANVRRRRYHAPRKASVFREKTTVAEVSGGWCCPWSSKANGRFLFTTRKPRQMPYFLGSSPLPFALAVHLYKLVNTGGVRCQDTC
jgi:hypothetical protein